MPGERTIARFLHITDTHLWPEGESLPLVIVVPLRGHDPGPWAAIWALVEREKPDAILWTGDVATAQHRTAYALANRELAPAERKPDSVRAHTTGIPVFCVPGNHDHYSIVGRAAVYLRAGATYNRTFHDAAPSVHHLRIRGTDFFIFCLDSSSGINVGDSLQLATGRIHRDDLAVVDRWRSVARRGGELAGEVVTPDSLRRSRNILLMHHDLGAKAAFHEMDRESATRVLKLMAATPIHLLACGHIHAPDDQEYRLFGPGRLDKRQRAALARDGTLRTQSVRISRAGTSSQVGAASHTVHIIEFDAGVRVRRLRFDGTAFS
jgi:3',5'-cyclic AMP phosphodiesterase CpdA